MKLSLAKSKAKATKQASGEHQEDGQNVSNTHKKQRFSDQCKSLGLPGVHISKRSIGSCAVQNAVITWNVGGHHVAALYTVFFCPNVCLAKASSHRLQTNTMARNSSLKETSEHTQPIALHQILTQQTNLGGQCLTNFKFLPWWVGCMPRKRLGKKVKWGTADMVNQSCWISLGRQKKSSEPNKWVVNSGIRQEQTTLPRASNYIPRWNCRKILVRKWANNKLR